MQLKSDLLKTWELRKETVARAEKAYCPEIGRPKTEKGSLTADS